MKKYKLTIEFETEAKDREVFKIIDIMRDQIMLSMNNSNVKLILPELTILNSNSKEE